VFGGFRISGCRNMDVHNAAGPEASMSPPQHCAPTWVQCNLVADRSFGVIFAASWRACLQVRVCYTRMDRMRGHQAEELLGARAADLRQQDGRV
jgi:hypothetical protein